MTRQQRRLAANRLRKATRGAELEYEQTLRRLVRLAVQRVATRVHKLLTKTKPLHQDAVNDWDDDIDELDEELSAELATGVSRAYDRMANRLSKANARSLMQEGIAIELRREPHIEAHMAKKRLENVQLIDKHKAAYFDDVRELFTDPDNYGLRPEVLAERLMDMGNVWQSRAELIARDQTLKLNSAITKERHQAAGIERYIWSTSMDDRVRPEHEELEGRVFSWDNPPDVGNPGEDFQCRCCAVPILPEEEEEEDDDES